MSSDIGDNPWLWPMNVGLRASAATFDAFAALNPGARRPSRCEPVWTTPHRIALDTPVLRVRIFRDDGGPPTVIVTPYALHGASLADIAPGHSLVERLLHEGVRHLVLVEWKSASARTRDLGIDDYLLRLSAVLDDFDGPATLIGLCQGGWLSLMLAARFPRKVARLVIAGAPIDLDAAPSAIVTAAREADLTAVETLVRTNGGLMPGRTLTAAWSGRGLKEPTAADVLQAGPGATEAIARFERWHAQMLDLPGRYYLEVFEDLFRRNQLARGEFQAFGRAIDLATVRVPLFVIASEHDEVTAPAQVMAAQRLVGTPPAQMASAQASGSHLSLFMGAQTLQTAWREAAAWLRTEH